MRWKLIWQQRQRFRLKNPLLLRKLNPWKVKVHPRKVRLLKRLRHPQKVSQSQFESVIERFASIKLEIITLAIRLFST